MTAPRVQQEDPMLRLQYYRETGQSGEAQQYEQYLRETGQWRETTNPRQAEYKSGALAKRMAGANARDAATLAEEQANAPGYAQRLVTHVLNAAQGIPGVRAVEAAAGSLGSKFTDNPLSFSEARGLLDEQTGNIGGKTAAVEKMIGSVATLPFLPANPAVAGGLLGATNEALSADDMSLTERGVRTGVGAGIGALIGRYADKAVTGVRSALAKNPASEVLRMKAERSLSARQLYDKAMAEGNAKAATPAIQKFVNEPDIAEIVAELQATRPFKNVKADAPEMLDAIYKTLSDRSATIKKGLESITPNKPNIGRYRGADVKAAQGEALAAMEQPGGGLPFMPSYREAVADFSQRTAELGGMQKGYEAVLAKVANNLPSFKNLDRKTPEAFAEWVKTATPGERAAAIKGLLGATKQAFGQPGKTLGPGRRAVTAATDLLRIVDPNAGRFANAGLLGINSMVNTP